MKRLNYSGSRYLFVIIFAFAIISISNSCTEDSEPEPHKKPGNTDIKEPGANEVWIQGSAYSPATITVTSGTTVTWTNKEGIIHTVTSNNELFDSGDIGNNGTYSFKFNAAGTFSYYCKLHPTMTATVVVN